MKLPEPARVVGRGAALPGTVAIVLPARNEAMTLPSLLGGLPAAVAGLTVRAIVVDDASTDATTQVALEAGAHVLRLPRQAGQGRALRAGYAYAVEGGAAIVVAMDADGQHRAADLSALVEPVARGEVDVATGSRVLGAADRGGPRMRELGIPILARVMSVLTGRQVSDPACGYRAMSAAAVARMDLRRDQFHTAEYLVHAGRLGLSVREVPVTILLRRSGVSRKPPTTRYALGFVATMFRTWGRGRLPIWRQARGCARGQRQSVRGRRW